MVVVVVDVVLVTDVVVFVLGVVLTGFSSHKTTGFPGQ